MSLSTTSRTSSLHGRVTRERLGGLVHDAMKRAGIQGLGLALVDGAETVLAEGFGHADVEEGVPVTADTVFKIGSITKVFTATALMQLVESGAVDLDAPVRRTLPELELRSRFSERGPITLRMLLSHHAGLPSDDRRHFYARQPGDVPEPFDRVIGYLAGHDVPYPPNHIFNYSNLGMDLVGLVIERASGRPYAEAVERGILAPLGMTRSSLGLPLPGTLAKGYRGRKGAWEPGLRDAPAGAVLASTADLARFVAMVCSGGVLDGHRILDASTLASMLVRAHPVCPLDLGFEVGLGWMLGRPALAHAGRVAWHDGSSQHYFGLTVVLPDHGLGVVVLTNNVGAALAVHRLADEVLGLALEEKTGLRPRPVPPPSKDERADLSAFAGEYPTATAGLGRLTVGPLRGPVLHLQDNAFRLDPGTDGFHPVRLLFAGIPLRLKQLEPLRVGFVTIDGEAVLALEQAGFRAALGRRWQRVPIPKAWRARAGRYVNVDEGDETFREVRLKAKKDLLVIEAEAAKLGKLKLALRPLDDGAARIEGLGRYAQETVRASDEDGKVRLELLGLLFERRRAARADPAG